MTSHDKNPSYSEQFNKIQNVRNQIVDIILILSAIIGFITILLTIINGLEIGWIAENNVLILMISCTITFAIFRKKLPYDTKAIVIIVLIYFAGVINFIGWGLIGSGATFFILMVLLSMIFYDIRVGLISYALTILTIAGIIFAMQCGWLRFNIDFEAYAYSGSAWASRAMIIILASALLVVALGRIIAVMREQLEQFREHSDELAQRTKELTNEVKKREETETALAEVVEHLKDLDNLKDNFIDSVSHELRTPIANIQLYHQLLAMNPSKSKEYMKTLKEETERLAHIVEQLIQATSDDYDMALSTMVDIELKSLVMSLFEQHEEALAENQISLSLPSTDEKFIILAAPEHIYSSLNKLVDNAVKYTNSGGEIIVDLCRDDSSEPAMINLSIQNTGDCPSEYEQKNLFDRFVRGEASLQRGIPGAGLGLSIARQIVEKYGGHIDFSCDSITGTLTFTVCLPSIIPLPESLASENPPPVPST